MSDLISREALGNKLSTLYEYYLKTRYLRPDGAVWDCIKLLCDAPTVDAVEVVHGHWNCNHYEFYILDENYRPVLFNGMGYKCNICNKDNEKTTDYCPNCGAKMDEVSE